MNVTDLVNMVINSLKITGKGTGMIQDNGDGTQNAVILTFKEPIDGDIMDFGNGNTSNIHDVKPEQDEISQTPDRPERPDRHHHHKHHNFWPFGDRHHHHHDFHRPHFGRPDSSNTVNWPFSENGNAGENAAVDESQDAQQTPSHIVSMEDVNTNYYEDSIQDVVEDNVQNETTPDTSSGTSSSSSWFASLLDTVTDFINSMIDKLVGNTK